MFALSERKIRAFFSLFASLSVEAPYILRALPTRLTTTALPTGQTVFDFLFQLHSQLRHNE